MNIARSTSKRANQYDVFISFRKEDGTDYAIQLRAALEEKGFTVFLDNDGFDNSPFYTGIFSTIEDSSVFLVLLTPAYFGCPMKHNDWALQEFSFALSKEKVFVFVSPDGQFNTIPDSLSESTKQQITRAPLFNLCFPLDTSKALRSLTDTLFNYVTIPTPLFISYTRSDKDIVIPFVKQLEEILNIRCWIDLEGIETGEQFEDVIIRAIDNSKIVLFMLSEHSLDSKWTRREVYYAESEGKRIVPIVVDGKGYRGWFKFHFGSINYIDIASSEQLEMLVSDIRAWLNKSPNQ